MEVRLDCLWRIFYQMAEAEIGFSSAFTHSSQLEYRNISNNNAPSTSIIFECFGKLVCKGSFGHPADSHSECTNKVQNTVP